MVAFFAAVIDYRVGSYITTQSADGGRQCAPSFDVGKDDITITSGATVFGTFLGPNQQFIVDHGYVTGEIVGGGNGAQISIHSGSTVTSPPTSVPGPVVGAGFPGLLLASAARSHWRRRRM